MNWNSSHDLNGNRKNHWDAQDAARDFYTGLGPSSHSSPNIVFLDQRMEKLENLIHSLVQANGQGAKRW